VYKQQNRYNTAMDRFSNFKLGMTSQLKRERTGLNALKLQCIRNYHVF